MENAQKTNVLLLGGGGREHAMAWALRKSPRLGKLVCAPGNGGIAKIAKCVDVALDDARSILSLARSDDIDLVVVGPEAPLAVGVADDLRAAGISVFGPGKDGAMLESSKSFAKSFMKRHGIPTAAYETFDDADKAIEYIERHGAPIVVKCDGLALGKGVIVARTTHEAVEAVTAALKDKVFGEAAGASVVIEEALEGPEMTVLAFCDGKTLSLMPCSQDHKRAYDGDEGPNTGGMGAFAPSPVYSKAIAEECENNIFAPTMKGLLADGIDYRGVIYFGMMSTRDGVKLIEYNARFGDPETQAILPLLKSDILEAFLAVSRGRLDGIRIEWDNKFSACVVIASGGYPGRYEKGKALSFAPGATADFFHAGTSVLDGNLVTSGGRVICSQSVGETLDEAVALAYSGIEYISFDGMFYRRDIGKRKT